MANSSNARRTREADSGRLTHAMNFEGRRVGVLLASWKRVGRRVVGVLVPEEALVGRRRLKLEEEILDRIPERMATPMVPQPRTVRVSDSGACSIFSIFGSLVTVVVVVGGVARMNFCEVGGGVVFLIDTVVQWLPTGI